MTCPLAELSDLDLVELERIGAALEALERSAEADLRLWAQDFLEKRSSPNSGQRHMGGLDRYWSRHLPGKKGDFMECVHTLMNSRKHFSEDSAKRLCNWLHRRHTGVAPGKE